MEMKQTSRRILSMCSVALLLLSATRAWSATVAIPPGGILQLGNSYTNATPTVTTSANVTNNDISSNVASSYTYSDSFVGLQSTISNSSTSNTYGFYDNFVFTITGSNLDSITSTINLSSGSSSTGLKNLDVQLFMLAGNATLPAWTPANGVNDILGVTNFTLSPSASGTVVVLDPTQSLTAGSYVLQIRGLADGSSGGSYAGVLDVTPVPLPAGVWLMIGALGVLVLFRRRPGAGMRMSYGSILETASECTITA
jgi:hypothetical protein